MLHLSSERIVYVIGGGPSLDGFDFSKLDGFKIGANRAAIVSKSDVLVSMDCTFEKRCRREIEEFDGEVILIHLRPELVKEKIKKAYYKKGNRSAGLSKDPEVVNGLNSGYAALNVAYQYGAKNIALLGFDMQTEGKKIHFHSEYTWQTGGGNYKSWTRFFDDAKRIFDRQGVTCTNYVGPNGSALTQFPTRPLEELDENYPRREG